MQCKESSDVPFHRTVYRYSKADWDVFRSFLADAPLDYFFNSRCPGLPLLSPIGFLRELRTLSPIRNISRDQTLNHGLHPSVLLLSPIATISTIYTIVIVVMKPLQPFVLHATTATGC